MKTLEETREFRAGERAGWLAFEETGDVDRAYYAEVATPPRRFLEKDSETPAAYRWRMGFSHGVGEAERSAEVIG